VGARQFFVQLVEHLASVSKLPTLIIWGDSDSIFTDKYRKRLEIAFPNHSTRTLRRVGPYPMSDAPEEFATAIRDWHPHSRALNTP
jgi:haloalkane dehalogenase